MPAEGSLSAACTTILIHPVVIKLVTVAGLGYSRLNLAYLTHWCWMAACLFVGHHSCFSMSPLIITPSPSSAPTPALHPYAIPLGCMSGQMKSRCLWGCISLGLGGAGGGGGVFGAYGRRSLITAIPAQSLSADCDNNSPATNSRQEFVC